jgi:hypothetical protein
MKWVCRALLIALAGCMAFGVYVYYDYWYRDVAEAFPADPVKQFKYGSTGGDRLAGIPVGIFNALPKLCRDYLPRKADGTPGEGWEALGFVYEPGMSRPVGTSMRHSLGFDRIGLNCATCHAGTWRATADARPTVVPGMPSHGIDLGTFEHFMVSCVLDERFNPWQVVQAAEETGAHYGPIDRLLLRYVTVPAMREAIVLLRFRFRFLDHEIASGPGRFDTFGPEKALLNWPLDDLDPRETVGIVDFPSLWLQGPREGMHLHWDGNNTSLEERNRSAAFGSGATPAILDRASLGTIAAWLRTPANAPPPFPFPIDATRVTRGATLYARYCAECHGANGRDFTGAKVGTVEPIANVRTDPCRLDNYTARLSLEQGNLYGAFPTERFSHFRKTDGYANAPLDGIWLRGPYLHNGSVPTVRDLLNPADQRPKLFWRGSDVVDPVKLGFVSTEPTEGNRALFRYETQCAAGAACSSQPNPENRHDDNVCHPGPWAGNSNRGHEYATDLPDADKDAIVEFLKTF